MELNSSAIIVCARKPLILLPSPNGTAIAQLSLIRIVHRSTSLRGPLLSEQTLLKIGSITPDCIHIFKDYFTLPKRRTYNHYFRLRNQSAF